MIYTSQPINIAGVPVVVDDLTAYATEMYQLYAAHLNSNLNYVKYLQRSRTTRPEFIDRFIRAYECNNEHDAALVKTLQDYIDPLQLVGRSIDPTNAIGGALKDYQYMRRDWCGIPVNEEQIELIEKPLRDILQHEAFKRQPERSLFIGAGVGRIAHDFCQDFTEVYATDKSFSMAWNYHRLAHAPIVFYDISNKNLLSLDKTAPQFTANFTPPPAGKHLEYFVSDVIHLPIESESLDVLYSVYFSDVIPLKLLFPQVDRVIREGGLFIHFGPLDYFFEEPTELLTAEEIVQYFEDRGYQTIANETVRTVHLEKENILSNKIYDNWFFAAVKMPKQAIAAPAEVLSPTTVLSIKGALRFSQEYRLTDEGEEMVDTKLLLGEGNDFEGAGAMLIILRLIDGQRSIEAILVELKESYDLPATEDGKILQHLKALVDLEVLAIV